MTNTISSYDAISFATASFLLPGLGQWLQRRRTAAIYFFGDSLACVLVGLWVPHFRGIAWTLAVAVNVWSVLDAVVAARRFRVPVG